MKAEEALKKLRRQIDRADAKLLEALAKRNRIVHKIAKAKAKLDLPIIHSARRAQIQRDRTNKGVKLGLEPVFIEKLFRLVQAESVQCQKKIIQTLKRKQTRSKKGKS